MRHARIGGLTTAGLAMLAAAAQAQAPQMTRAEARQLYAAGGFPISADDKGPTNRCGQRANPKITFLDLNSDRRKDALFTDAGACYGADQRWFAMAVKEADGRWRGVGGFPGTANAVKVAANGWFSLNWTSKGRTQPLNYNGQAYAVGSAMAASAPPAAKPAASAPPAATVRNAAPAPAAGGAARDAAIFAAAGFKKTRRGWESGCDDPSAGAAYDAGRIDVVKDVNGDGRLEAVVVEGGTYCYGNTGEAFWLLSQQPNGSWKTIFNDTGIAEFLTTKGVGGWPDISIGGPGFCFPVARWNGSVYVRNRFAYEGKPCRP